VSPWAVVFGVVLFVLALGVVIAGALRSQRSAEYKAMVVALVGLAVALLLPIFARPIEVAWDQLTVGEATAHPAADAAPSPPQRGVLTPATASQLIDDVQLSRFVELLGAPLSQERLQNDEWLASTWESPDLAVTAFSNGDAQVVAFTLTSLGPEFTPVVEHLSGGVRLRTSVFADVADQPVGVAGNYPANARYSYEELYRGGPGIGGRSVVLAASYSANADDPATRIGDLACLPYSVFEQRLGCSPEQLSPLREALHITSVTIGEWSALEALAQDGAFFYPEPS
jgi:hypothetical protein